MSSAKYAILCFVLLATLLTNAEATSIFGIGMRIIGDQILVKDILQSPPAAVDENPTIGFNYAVTEPITYIQIEAEQNMLAEVNFSYHNDLVKGTVTAVNTTKTSIHATEPFEILITIFGFNETMLNVNPAYILNRDQQFDGVLKPHAIEDDEDYDDADDYVNQTIKLNARSTSNAQELMDDDSAEDFDIDADNEAEDEAEFPRDFNSTDKILELGSRQQGDYLLHATFQTSATATKQFGTHSVVFYYIDSDFVTYIKFVVYDHYMDNSDTEQDLVVAEYSHYTPNSLKAIITDHKTTSLFVQMFVYGYKLMDRPVEYVPYTAYITSGQLKEYTGVTMSPTQRLRMLMNAIQSTEATIVTNAPHTTAEQQQISSNLNNVMCNENMVALNGVPSLSTVLLPMPTAVWSILCGVVIFYMYFAAQQHH